MKSGMVRVWSMPFAVLVMLLGRPDPTAADGIRAAAAVNGEVFGNVGPANVIGDGNSGLSIAAAKVFNPVKDAKAISKTVGTNKVAADQRVPTAGGTEDKRLNDAMEALAALPAAKDKNAVLKEAADKVFGLKPAPGVFQELKKGQTVGNYLQAEAGSVSNPTVAETARGFAKQTLSKVEFPGGGKSPIYTYSFEQQVRADVDKKDEKSPVVPAATAFALNRDPIAVEWEVPEFTITLRDLLTDPSNPLDVSLVAQATPGAASSALYGFDVGFVNFDDPDGLPSDLSTLEEKASNLFSFSMFLANDGNALSKLVNLTLGTGATIRDNFGDTSPGLVLARLNTVLQIGDGILGFNSETPFFSFTIGIPDDPFGSVLFTRDFGAAAAEAAPVPEPSTIVLLGTPMLALVVNRLRARPGSCK